jgi:hypothetical protein
MTDEDHKRQADAEVQRRQLRRAGFQQAMKSRYLPVPTNSQFALLLHRLEIAEFNSTPTDAAA